MVVSEQINCSDSLPFIVVSPTEEITTMTDQRQRLKVLGAGIFTCCWRLAWPVSLHALLPH
jgi:hypothetical protein